MLIVMPKHHTLVPFRVQTGRVNLPIVAPPPPLCGCIWAKGMGSESGSALGMSVSLDERKEAQERKASILSMIYAACCR